MKSGVLALWYGGATGAALEFRLPLARGTRRDNIGSLRRRRATGVAGEDVFSCGKEGGKGGNGVALPLEFAYG